MSSVAEAELEIINQLGLHARAAAQLVKVANAHPCEVLLTAEGQTVNGKSIMGVLMLAAGVGTKLTVKCSGDDAEGCLSKIRQLVEGRFGEEQ